MFQLRNIKTGRDAAKILAVVLFILLILAMPLSSYAADLELGTAGLEQADGTDGSGQ